MSAHIVVTKGDTARRTPPCPELPEPELRGILRDAIARCPAGELPEVWAVLGIYADQGYMADLMDAEDYGR